MIKDFTIDFVNQFFLKDIPVQNKDYQYSIIIIICLSHLCSILKDNTKALELLNDFIKFIDQKESLSQILINYFNEKFNLNDLSLFFTNKNSVYLEKVSFISILRLAICTEDEKEALNFVENIVKYLNIEYEFKSVKNYFNCITKIEIPNKTKLDNKIYNHISNYIDYRNKLKNNFNLDKCNKFKNNIIVSIKNLTKILNKYNYNINDFDNYKKLQLHLKNDINKDTYLSELIILNLHIENLFLSINNLFNTNKNEYEYKLKHIKKLDLEKNNIIISISEFKDKVKNESNNIRNYSVICINKIIEKFNSDLSKEIPKKISIELKSFKEKNDKDVIEFLNRSLNSIILDWIQVNTSQIIPEQKKISMQNSFSNLKKLIPNIKEEFNIQEDSTQFINESLTNFILNDLSSAKKSLSNIKNSYYYQFFIDLFFSKNSLSLLLKLIKNYYSSKFIYTSIAKSIVIKELKDSKIDEKIRLSIKNDVEKEFNSLSIYFQSLFSSIFNEMEYQLSMVTIDYNNYLKRIDDSEKSIKTKILNLEIDIAKIQFLKENITTKLSKIYINSIK